MSDKTKTIPPAAGSATIKITKPAPAKGNQPPSPATRAAIRRKLGLDSIGKRLRP